MLSKLIKYQLLFSTVICYVFFMSFSAFSETETDNSSNRSYAVLFERPLDNDSLLRQFSNIEKNIKQISPLKAQFRQERNIKGLQKPLVSKGNIFFSVDNGIIWEINSPIYLKTAMMPDGSIRTDNSGESETPDQPVFKQYMKIITSLFSGDIKSLRKVFSVYFMKNENGNTLTGLIPERRSVSKFLNRIIIEISSSGYIKKFILTTENSESYIIDFSRHASITDEMMKKEICEFENSK